MEAARGPAAGRALSLSCGSDFSWASAPSRGREMLPACPLPSAPASGLHVHLSPVFFLIVPVSNFPNISNCNFLFLFF